MDRAADAIVVGFLLALAFASPARAQGGAAARNVIPPPAEGGQVYSAYEDETIDQELRARHETRDPAPEGKRIEGIDVVPLAVFEPRDVVPAWVNTFHATTRPSIIRRELLVFEGEPYRQTLVDETIRNLRRLPQLSVVLVLATRGETPAGVRVMIITKDVWSLRASWDLVANAGGIEEFTLAPTETNLLGTHQTIRAELILEPSTTTWGLAYTMPRIGDSRLAALTSADLVVNRDTGSVEGSYGSLVAGRPLVSALTAWSWDSTVKWQDTLLRRYVNAEPSVYLDARTGYRVPYQYRSRVVAATYEVTRSFGWDVKHDFTLAANIALSVFRGPNSAFASTLTTPYDAGRGAQAIADFDRAIVPVSDTLAGPSLTYHSYRKRFLRVIDLDTLALQEDVRLGHEVVVSVFPSPRVFGSTRDVLRFEADVQTTQSFGDGFARASFSSVTEVDLGQKGAPVQDASVSPSLHIASPTIAKLGRIVVDGTLLYRWRNYLNQLTSFGGESRLRGFPTSFFVGKDWLAYNFELRSRPVEIVTCQLAGVLFADIGDAFDGFAQLRPVQSVGFGVRVLFPQLDRIVFRADAGFPLTRPIDPSTRAPVGPLQYVISFAQAFDAPSISPSPVLPTGQ